MDGQQIALRATGEDGSFTLDRQREEYLKLVYNEELPNKIRRALVSEAKRRDIRVSDVAGEVLAAHVGLTWELSGHPYRVERARIDKIRVPERLHRLIRAEALGVTDGSGTMRGVVLSILASHFDLAEVSKIRRPRKEIV